MIGTLPVPANPMHEKRNKLLKPSRAARRWRPDVFSCVCCKGEHAFCWRCPCGFMICQACLHENAWGMTCNWITWQCPDCGRENGFGNQ